jgi:hypothetical protein
MSPVIARAFVRDGERSRANSRRRIEIDGVDQKRRDSEKDDHHKDQRNTRLDQRKAILIFGSIILSHLN